MSINIGAKVRINVAGHNALEVARSLNNAERYYRLSTSGGGWKPQIPRWRVEDENNVVLPRFAPSILTATNIAFWLDGRHGITIPLAAITWDTENDLTAEEMIVRTHADGYQEVAKYGQIRQYLPLSQEL